MNSLHEVPGTHYISARVPSAATAGTALTAVGVAPFKSKVVAAYWIPDSAMTGAASNNRAIDIQNGTATAQVATVTYTNAVDATANVKNSLTLGTGSALNLAAGDVVNVSAEVNGTGLPLPAGTIVVAIKAR